MANATYSINAITRTKTGKEICKKLRASGSVPIIYYGQGIENKTLQARSIDIVRLLRQPKKKNTLIALYIDDAQQPLKALIKDYQFHPVNRKLVHVDMIDVTKSESVVLKVPVRLIGKTEGEKIGGKNNFVVRELKISTSPDNIPTTIDVDVEGLQVGQQIRISTLPLPEGITAIYRTDQPIIISNAPKRIDEDEVAEDKEEEAATE